MEIPDPFDFTGATALIVGGAAGLGRAMADGLADRGASVCIVARTEARARKAADAVAMRSNSPCHACTADFTSEDSVNALGEEVNRLFEGRLNVAVNCAGINV